MIQTEVIATKTYDHRANKNKKANRKSRMKKKKKKKKKEKFFWMTVKI